MRFLWREIVSRYFAFFLLTFPFGFTPSGSDDEIVRPLEPPAIRAGPATGRSFRLVDVINSRSAPFLEDDCFTITIMVQ
jgi:hypothetical protein